MILAIRISGMVKIPKTVQETLYRMRLRRKYAAVLLQPTEANKKLLQRMRNYVAYGPINRDMLTKLIELRGQPLPGKEINTSTVVSNIDKKTLQELDLKPFFRLHPPRGGIESKKHFGVGKGVLGDNKEHINQLLERML